MAVACRVLTASVRGEHVATARRERGEDPHDVQLPDDRKVPVQRPEAAGRGGEGGVDQAWATRAKHDAWPHVIYAPADVPAGQALVEGQL
jgi:hypothetical protein